MQIGCRVDVVGDVVVVVVDVATFVAVIVVSKLDDVRTVGRVVVVIDDASTVAGVIFLLMNFKVFLGSIRVAIFDKFFIHVMVPSLMPSCLSDLFYSLFSSFQQGAANM